MSVSRANFCFGVSCCSWDRSKAQRDNLEWKTNYSSHFDHAYLPQLYLSPSSSFAVEFLSWCSMGQSLLKTLPKRLTDWLTEKTSNRIECRRQTKMIRKRFLHTCATWADNLVAALIFNGTVRARDIARLASATELRGGSNDPIVIEALPLSPCNSLVATALRALTPRAPISPRCSGVPSCEKVEVHLESEILLPEVELQGSAPPEAAILSSIQVLIWEN